MPDKARPWPITLLIICAILLIAAIAIGTATAVSIQRERALADGEREIRNTALILAAQIDRTFQAIELVQTDLIERMRTRGITSREDYERRASDQPTHLMLKDLIAGLPQIAAIGLIDLNGRPVNFSSQWPPPTLNVADRDYFNALVLDTQAVSFVSAPVRGLTSHEWNVVIARKFTAPTGEMLGLITATVRLQYFESFFSSILLGDTGSIALLRNDGVVLVRYPVIEKTIGRTFMPMIDALRNREQGSLRVVSQMDARDRLLAAHRLAHNPLLVVVGRDIAAILAPWQAQARLLIIAAGVLACAILVIFVGIARRLRQGQRQTSQQLAEQKLQLDAALNNMSQGLLMFDASERIVVCNRRYIDLYGLSTDVVKPGCTFRQLLAHRKDVGSLTGDIEEYRSRILGDLAQGTVTHYIRETPDGRSIRIVNQPKANGGWVVTHEDITEQRRAEQERDRNQQFLDLIIDNVPVTIVVKDARERRYVLINRAAEKLLGLRRQDTIGKTAFDVYPQPQAELVTGHDDQLIVARTQLFFDEHSFDTRENGTRILTSNRLTIFGDDGKPNYLIAVIEDVTEQRHALERIVRLANYDALTGLPNRELFRVRLEQALATMAQEERLAVFYLDLDQFKSVNDSLGHPVGDELLKAVAARLRNCVKDADTVARLGGDEFALIQVGVREPADFAALVRRIYEAVRAPYDLDGHQLFADVSIGIAVAPDDGSEPTHLLKHADLAMYRAKGEGRGTYRFFEPEMDAQMRARRHLELDMRKAIAKGEFELHYQPIVDLEHGKIGSCEALVRWHHPQRGFILPAEFIPVAEETGLIVSLGEWVLRQACAEAAAWPNDVRVAVNLSPAQFRSPTLTHRVISALAAAGLSPQRLDLEITETVLMQNNDAVLGTLHQLQGLGARIALDDFGTGYSSLGYLRSFPFDKIKIDQSFIKDLSSSDDCLAIVQSIIAMAKGLNMAVTAEGVETTEQLKTLRAIGCAEMQGHLFCGPKPAEELRRKLFSLAEREVRVA